MTNEDAIEQFQNAVDLIKQNGEDWLDERDIPMLEMAICALKNKQADGDLISRKEIVDMIDKLYDDFCNSDGGETFCTIDGKTYTSDMGYAFDGIEMFIEVFKKRLAEKGDTE